MSGDDRADPPTAPSLPPLRSGPSRIRSYVRFINQTDRTVDVIWLNHAGLGVRYRALSPQQTLDVNTFVGHPWIFRDSETGARLCVQLREVYEPVAWQPSADQGGGAPRRRLVYIRVHSLRDRCLQEIRRLVPADRLHLLDLPREIQNDLLPPSSRAPTRAVINNMAAANNNNNSDLAVDRNCNNNNNANVANQNQVAAQPDPPVPPAPAERPRAAAAASCTVTSAADSSSGPTAETSCSDPQPSGSQSPPPPPQAEVSSSQGSEVTPVNGVVDSCDSSGTSNPQPVNGELEEDIAVDVDDSGCPDDVESSPRPSSSNSSHEQPILLPLKKRRK